MDNAERFNKSPSGKGNTCVTFFAGIKEKLLVLITEDTVFKALKSVVDPEIGIGIVDLGLVYGADIENGGKKVTVRVTLTSPVCPHGQIIVSQVDDVLKTFPGVEETEVKIVWEPQWDPRTMASDEVKDKIGIW